MSTYIDSAELYYSEIFPNGLYAHFRDEGVALPIADSLSKTQTTPVVRNVLSHELFYCKKVFLSSDEKKKTIISEILKPSTALSSWPVDVIAVGEKTDNNDESKPINLRHFYCDEYHRVAEPSANYYLLFPYDKRDKNGRGGYVDCKPLDLFLLDAFKNKQEQKNYKNTKIRKICLGICKSIEKLNKDGYVYFDFSLSRFMVHQDMSIVPEYTNLLVDKNLGKKKNVKGLSAEYGNVPLEFFLPYVYFVDNNMRKAWESDHGNSFVVSTQNFCLAAMLFYLMFNRKPYDGDLLKEKQDDEQDLVVHYNYLINYYLKDENIDFIFDTAHESKNSLIGDYSSDLFINEINLWSECDKEIKEMFIKALKRKSAMKDQYVLAPNASSWVNLFEKLGWGN